MKLLKDILYKVAIKSVLGSTDREVSKIEFDSRKVQQNNVFVAIKGNANDGHHYIEKAIEKGAVAIVHEDDFTILGYEDQLDWFKYI